MPTARELLEQADALMRRNRAAAIDDIPVLTDSVPMQGERAPSERVPAMPKPVAPVPPAAVPAPAAASAAGIPTLTERAAPGGPHEPPDSMLQEGGEPSDWLEFEGAEPSVIGEAPDSVAIVPPVDRVRVDNEALLMAAEHEEIELTTPAEEAFDDEFEPRESPREVAPEPAHELRDVEAPVFVPAEAPEPVPDATPAPAAPPEHVPEQIVVTSESTVATPAPIVAPPGPAWWPVEASTPMPADAGAIATPATPADAAFAPLPVAPAVEPVAFAGAAAAEVRAPAHPVIAEPEPGLAASAASAADEQAKWDAIAEEVRVQVLQRIDLFTDAGLRDQLGVRLKPIVDRASADLVATINLSVGELLRAYVAEAIEREIESWRRNH
ncbi:MAG: hypothetical protein U1F58_16700 [Burkholderiales bacterium]